MEQIDNILTLIAQEIYNENIAGYKNLLFLLYQSFDNELLKEKILDFIEDLFINNIISENGVKSSKEILLEQYNNFIPYLLTDIINEKEIIRYD